jgi:UDP-N-acetylmuramoyl-tripeptide--D-alanyl-D-alanine ligase
MTDYPISKALITAVLGPSVLKDFDYNILRLSIDSRTLKAGSIFLALRGENFDGNNYVADALKQGALLAIAEKDHPGLKDLDKSKIVEVPDTLKTLADCARLHIQSLKATRIAITGSSGKTSTKEMLKAALEELVGPNAVFASPGNKNNHIGLPLNALLLGEHHRFALFEMGMNHSGEIAALASIVEPHFGLITNIGTAHSGNFPDGILGVARAKSELLSALEPFGHAVINADDEHVVRNAQTRNFAALTSFGTKEGADLRLLHREKFDEKKSVQEIDVQVLGFKAVHVNIPLLGAHQAMNALATLAVIKALGLSLEKAASGIAHMAPSPGRMEIIPSHKGFIIVNDAYNANPDSMRAGILATKDIKAQRRIAVIGAMKELGTQSEALHYALGEELSKAFDRFFICCTENQACIKALVNNNISPENITYKNDADSLFPFMADYVRAGDLIFIKGSKSTHVLSLVKRLMEL